MRVLLNPTGTKKKLSRNVDRRKRRTPETCVPPQTGAPRSTTRRVWHNWLMEENYL
jgi:hypothetical protein